MTGNDLATQPAAAATDSLRAWIDGVARRLIALAARRAPATLAARLEEEWSADLLARPGPISHVSFALGCLWAATVISWDGDTVAAATSSPGKAVGRTSRTVSHDGKQMTLKTSATSAKSEKSESVMVFDRQ
jgi:hypothetical protein